MFTLRFIAAEPHAGLMYEQALWRWEATCKRCGAELEGYVGVAVGERMEAQLKNHERAHAIPEIDAIRAFQRRHGLIEDGVVGPETRAAGYRP